MRKYKFAMFSAWGQPWDVRSRMVSNSLANTELVSCRERSGMRGWYKLRRPSCSQIRVRSSGMAQSSLAY